MNGIVVQLKSVVCGLPGDATGRWREVVVVLAGDLLSVAESVRNLRVLGNLRA